MKTRDYELNVYCDGYNVLLLAYKLRATREYQPNGDPRLELIPGDDWFDHVILRPEIPEHLEAIRYVLDNDDVTAGSLWDDWQDHDEWFNLRKYLTEGNPPNVISAWVASLPEYELEVA